MTEKQLTYFQRRRICKDYYRKSRKGRMDRLCGSFRKRFGKDIGSN